MEKCNFALSHLDYLGHTISGQGIKPSKKKIEAVVEWPKPHTVKQVQSFLGFCNFYRRYVPKYSQISNPLYNLKKKDVKFDWNLECKNAFQQLKHLLTTNPVLRTAKTGPTQEFVLSTDASQFGMGAVLLQKDENNDLRPSKLLC